MERKDLIRSALLVLALLLAACTGTLLEFPPGTQGILVTGLASTATQTAATITWTTNVSTTDLVEYGTASGTYSAATVQSHTPLTTHSVSLSGLSSSTRYYFRVRNFHTPLADAVSTESTVTTTAYPVIQVTLITSANIQQTTADIQWTTDVPTTHLVEYGTTSGVYTYSTSQTSTAVTSHVVSLSGLTALTKYYFRVINFNPPMPDALSAESSFTTIDYVHPTLAERQRGIWIFGGLTGSLIGTTVGQVDLYDPVTNIWYSNVTTLPTPVSFAAAASYGGKFYVFGGFDSVGNVRNDVQIYNVAAGTWSSGIVMTSARANISAVVVNNKIYVLGGSTGNAGAIWVGSTTTYEYTPGGTWNTKTAYSAANYSEHLLLALNDVIYNFGGRSAAAVVTAAADGFAVTLNNITTGSTEVVLTAARTGMTGMMYSPGAGPAMMAIVGGFSALTATTGNFIAQGTTASTPTNLFQYLYYPFTAPATWTNPPNQYPLSVGFSAAAMYGSMLYVFGGTAAVTGAAIGLNNSYSFDLSNLNGAWTSFTSMPVGRYGHAAATYLP